MYKGAHQALVHRTAVDRPHPSRGYIDGGPEPFDVLPDITSLSVDQLRSEQLQLRREVAQCEQELALAKVVGRKRDGAAVGQRKATLSTRLSAINRRIRELDGDSELFRLRTAIRELADPEVAELIFQRAQALRGKLSAPRDSGSRSESHDPEEGHGPKDGRAASEGGIAQ